MQFDKNFIVEKIKYFKKIFDPDKKTYARLDKINTSTSFYEMRNEIYNIKDNFYLPEFLKNYLFFIELNLDAIIEGETLSVRSITLNEIKTEEIIDLMDLLKIRIGNNSRYLKDLKTLEEKDNYLNELKGLLLKRRIANLKMIEQSSNLVTINEDDLVNEDDFDELNKKLKMGIASNTAASNVIIFLTSLIILFILILSFLIIRIYFK